MSQLHGKSVVDNEYLDFDISNCMYKFLGEEVCKLYKKTYDVS